MYAGGWDSPGLLEALGGKGTEGSDDEMGEDEVEEKEEIQRRKGEVQRTEEQRKRIGGQSMQRETESLKLSEPPEVSSTIDVHTAYLLFVIRVVSSIRSWELLATIIIIDILLQA